MATGGKGLFFHLLGEKKNCTQEMSQTEGEAGHCLQVGAAGASGKYSGVALSPFARCKNKPVELPELG